LNQFQKLQASLKELDLTTKDKKKGGAKTAQVKDESDEREESHNNLQDEKEEASANFLNDSVDGVDERAEKKR
jgi:hypothetical protein